jgi:hypothetical protein
MTRSLTEITRRNDWLLRRLFALAARGLPLAQIGEVRRPYPAHLVDAQSSEAAPEREPERAVRRSYRSSAT